MSKDNQNFPEYYALSEYHRRCLPGTNYARLTSGQPLIPVPPDDAYYWSYFNKKVVRRDLVITKYLNQ